MDAPDLNSTAGLAQAAGLTGIGGIALAFLGRFFVRKMAEEKTATERAVGEGDVIAMLRAEVERLANACKGLGDEVFRLQGLLIEQRKVNAELADEISHLRNRLKELTTDA